MSALGPDEGCRPARALIVLLSPHWTGIARLPRALASAGWQVASLCPAQSFLALTRFNHACEHLPPGQNPLYALNSLVARWAPDCLIPGCDAAVAWLQHVVEADAQGRWPAQATPLLNMVKRSLGPFDPRHSRLSKHENLARAARLGIPVPAQSRPSSWNDALARAAQMGWPVVLKADTGAAGATVRVCQDAHALQRAWAELLAVTRQAPALQAYLSGTVAMCAGVAVDGVLLDSVSAVKLQTHPSPTSPCSVHRHLDSPAMSDALARLVQDLRFTGLCAADFIIEATTGTPRFIEFNPRPVPLTAQAALYGHDLAAAWAAHLKAQTPVKPAAVKADTVALFPNEWARDRNSPHLTTAYHDVPHDDPALLQALWRSVGVNAP